MSREQKQAPRLPVVERGFPHRRLELERPAQCAGNLELGIEQPDGVPAVVRDREPNASLPGAGVGVLEDSRVQEPVPLKVDAVAELRLNGLPSNPRTARRNARSAVSCGQSNVQRLMRRMVARTEVRREPWRRRDLAGRSIEAGRATPARRQPRRP